MDALSAFGLFAVTTMPVCYAPEHRSSAAHVIAPTVLGASRPKYEIG
jgi:hypothetical protein